MGTEFDALLAGYAPEVKDLARRARALVRAALPGATEEVEAASRLVGYSYGPKMGDLVCVIMPLKAAVNLGITGGATLPDPAGLMTGTGKRHRHVRLDGPADLENPALRALIEAAAAGKRPTKEQT